VIEDWEGPYDEARSKAWHLAPDRQVYGYQEDEAHDRGREATAFYRLYTEVEAAVEEEM